MPIAITGAELIWRISSLLPGRSSARLAYFHTLLARPAPLAHDTPEPRILLCTHCPSWKTGKGGYDPV